MIIIKLIHLRQGNSDHKARLDRVDAKVTEKLNDMMEVVASQSTELAP
jgi:hypothetical protein